MIISAMITFQRAIEESRTQLRLFFVGMREAYGNQFCTFKNHLVTHAPDDVKMHKVQLDAMAAYPFENTQSVFMKVGVISIYISMIPHICSSS
jgi:hypothetical protein